MSGDHLLRVRRGLGLHPIDELNELGRALDVAEEDVFFGHTGRRIAAEREEAGDPRIQKLANEPGRPLVRVADTGEVRERRDIGGGEDVPEHLEGDDRRPNRPRRTSRR